MWFLGRVNEINQVHCTSRYLACGKITSSNLSDDQEKLFSTTLVSVKIICEISLENYGYI